MRSLVLLACAACGSVEGKTPDAAVSTKMDAMIDGAGSGSNAPCDVTKPFGTPTLVPGVNTTDQGGHQRFGYFSSDLLSIYFSDIPGTNRQIWKATRGTPTGTFGQAQVVQEVVSTAQEEHASITSDGLILVYDTSAFNSTYDIAMATRMNPAQTWQTSLDTTYLQNVNSPNTQEGDSWISLDGLTLLFGSSRMNNDYAVYISTRAATTGNFSVPTRIDELNDVTATDSGGMMSADKLEIFWFSDRGGGSGLTDIWHATRTSPTAAFSNVTPVTELNSANVDVASWLSPDRCSILFSSDRLGTYDIYMATRPQ